MTLSLRANSTQGQQSGNALDTAAKHKVHIRNKECSPGSQTYLRITDILIHCIKPVEGVIHLDEVCLKEHLYLMHVGIIFILARSAHGSAFQAESAKRQAQ